MPTHRRRAPQHLYNIEPAPPPPANNWLTTLGGVPVTFVLTFIVTAAIFYGVTQYRLSQYDSDIAAMKLEQKQAAPALSAKIDGEAQQRTAARNEFLASQKETTNVLSQISSRLAVSETKQEATNKALDTTNQTLSKISDQLQQLNSRTVGGAR